MSASYIRSPDATESLVGDRMVLYHRVSRTALVLNPTGTRLWRLLEHPCTTDALVRDLCGAHRSLTEDQAARDVDTFLKDLSQHAMVSAG